MTASDSSKAQALFDAALAARANAYAPYSNYAVGAAVLTDKGEIFVGANVENASYPNGTCAEAGAIAAMVAAGSRIIVEALIVGGDNEPPTPCGACRQRLWEFAGPDMLLHVASPGGIRANFTLGTLLPAAFMLAQSQRHDTQSCPV